MVNDGGSNGHMGEIGDMFIYAAEQLMKLGGDEEGVRGSVVVGCSLQRELGRRSPVDGFLILTDLTRWGSCRSVDRRRAIKRFRVGQVRRSSMKAKVEMNESRVSPREVALWVPNLICYARVALLCCAFGLFLESSLVAFWVTYGISICMDAVDGYAARKLGQTSEFGAFLDVTIDIASRGLLLCRAYPTTGPLLVCLESFVFCVNHRLGKDWKAVVMENSPWHVRAIFRNGFKSPLGVLSMIGLFLLPIYGLLTKQVPQLSNVAAWHAFKFFLFGCRSLCASVEIFCLWRHLKYLASLEASRQKSS